MEQIIQNLKAKEIIYRKSVEVLKKYIENKYPEANEQVRAQVFADAIHKIIDDHIREFRRADQRKIKHNLLIRTASKDNFEIVAYDIMKTCVALEINEETFVSNLTSWINRQQELPVYREQMNELTSLVREELVAELTSVQDQQVSTVDRPLKDIAISTTEDAPETIDESVVEELFEENLLEQLVSAFEYEPSEELSDRGVPELYTQGAINEAYEAEIRKDKIDKSLEQEVSKIDDMEETLFPDQDFIINDLEVPLPLVEEDQRPVIKVEMEPEPYFSETPNIWEEEQVKLTLLAGIKATVSAYSKEKLILAIMGAIGLLIIIAIIIAMVNGLYNKPEVLEEATTMLSTSLTDSGDIVEPAYNSDVAEKIIEMNEAQLSNDTSHLHSSLQFKAVDNEALQAWFSRNGSMVGQSPYFETILEVAEAYGVNPLLLFAITGQEQSFVPKDHEFAEVMINNPFNVYGSWETYNTHLEESAQIAARTILTASEERPNDVDPVDWINQTYAEDENWSTGVNIILEQLEAVAGN